jgi:Putative adhesin
MKRSISYAAIAAAHCLVSATASAWPNLECRSNTQHRVEIDAAGAVAVVIDARAGDLKIRGYKSGSLVRVTETACTSSPQAPASGVRVERVGTAIRVEADRRKSRIRIEVPAELPIALQDSSGISDIGGIAGGKIVDGAGELTVHDVSGSLDVDNGSGDIHIARMTGSLRLDNRSGDILISDVKGNVLITRDGSGDITVLRTGADLSILQDSAGEITVDSVGGNFDLERKSSGAVHVSRIKGTTHVPAHMR